MKTATIQGDTWEATIRIGKDAKENDALYTLANANDYWFHLKDAPSAHVYMELQGNVGKREMRNLMDQCAQFVRENSRCHHLAKVDCIQRKYLSKDAQCKHGEVILTKRPMVV